MDTIRRMAARLPVVLGLTLAMSAAALAEQAGPPAAAPPGAAPPGGAAGGAPGAPVFSEPPLRAQAVANLTDEMVWRAIERGREYLINQQRPDGGWGNNAGHSALVFMTLAYMGQHPNREVMSKGLDHLLVQNPDTDFDGRPGYGLPIRIMGLSYIYNKLLSDKRTIVRLKMMEDLRRLELGQNPDGGWRYKLDSTDYDFSVTQWPILAMREASLVGIEFAEGPLRKARDLYFRSQRPDGGWAYAANLQPGTPMSSTYGSMTAAGLASLFIISDVLDPGSGCPCKSGHSQAAQMESDRRIDSALAWLSKNFKANENPGINQWNFYWLYCVERVGIAAGYKYFGDHNWYKEGASLLVSQQMPNGAWGDPLNTCFALLFLYKGRAPILFNKLKFDGTWNAHRRDIAHLTAFIEKAKEQQFQWQIVELKSPLEELHDAPILYLTAETLPQWQEADRKKLRAFTDTGGTILFEASCGNPAVRKWFQEFAKKVWPEWGLKPLGPDHGVFTYPTPLKQRPELLGINDGIRTCVFYSTDDISCHWNTKAVASKGYLFNWGINLYTYATDGAPLRAKLAGNEFDKTPRYKEAVKAGPKTSIKIARLKHSGNWNVGANYRGFAKLAEILNTRAAITLDAKEAEAAAPAECGTAVAELADYPVAYVAGTAAFAFKPEEKEALKAYVSKGGRLWFEAVMGAQAFDQSLQQLASEMNWQLRPIPKEHGLMTGSMDPASGYKLTTGVEFKSTLKVPRAGRAYADLLGVYEGDRMVGLYSPFDVMISLTGYEAYRCRGYKAPDAAAVATNIVLYLSTLK